jgi:hypothetical protein
MLEAREIYVEGGLISLWLSKGILFLKDDAATHKAAIMHPELADLHFEVLKHPAYSPDLAPSNYYLFPNLKKHGADKCLAFSISYFPICSTTKRIFLGWVTEVRTTKS